ncbi:MAG: hypothetical protein LUG26_07980 [Ruminococcus sp.]|nr:hypothetical protein [Ruminococcus sp.]
MKKLFLAIITLVILSCAGCSRKAIGNKSMENNNPIYICNNWDFFLRTDTSIKTMLKQPVI